MTAAVLVVDEDRFVRKLIATTLHGIADFALLEAADGEQALATAVEHRPRLVLLDVELPRMDGIATCRALRSRAELHATRIVLLTAGAEHEPSARAAGADDVLVKPFSPLGLLRLVDEVMAA